MGSSNFDAKLTKSPFGDFEAVIGLGCWGRQEGNH
jgi:hypothetical protein